MTSFKAGYARNETQSQHPSLWRGCVAAWCPSLGATGHTLHETTGRGLNGDFVGTMSGLWEMKDGDWSLYCHTNTGYFNMGSNSALQPSLHLSVSVWTRLDSSVQYAGIVSCVYDSGTTESGWGLHGGAGSTIQWNVRTGNSAFDWGVLQTDSIADSKWHHIVGTYDGVNRHLYLDGELVGSDATTHTNDYNPVNDLKIGVYKDNDEQYDYKGWVDDVRIYNRAMGLGEIKLLGRRRGVAYEQRHRQVYKVQADSSAIPAIHNYYRRMRQGA